MNLYRLSEEYQTAMAGIEAMLEFGDIDMTAAADTLEGLRGEVEEKAEAVALYIKGRQAMAAALREEKKALDARIKACESAAEWLQDYLADNLRKAGIQVVETSKVEIKFRKLPDIVDVTGDVTPEFQRVIPEKREPDKVAIKAALTSGLTLPFAELVTGRTGLQIK